MLLPITLGILVGGLAFAHFFPGNFLMATLGCVLGGLIAYFAFEFGETRKAFRQAWRRTFCKDNSWERIKKGCIACLKYALLGIVALSSAAMIMSPMLLMITLGKKYESPLLFFMIMPHYILALMASAKIGIECMERKPSFRGLLLLINPFSVAFYWPFVFLAKYARPTCCLFRYFALALCRVTRDAIDVIHNRTRKLVALWAIVGIAGYHIFGGYWFVWTIGCTISCYVHDATVLVELRRPLTVNGA